MVRLGHVFLSFFIPKCKTKKFGASRVFKKVHFLLPNTVQWVSARFKRLKKHVSRHLQANRWGEHSRVGENIAWENTKKNFETKKTTFRKMLKNLQRHPSKEAIFKIFSSVAHLVLKCYASQDFLPSPRQSKRTKKF